MTIKSGIIAGILAIILAFISKIPIYPPENWELSLRIFAYENLEFFFWGYLIDGGTAFTSLIGIFPDNIISICIGFMILMIGLNSIMASTSKANPNNSIKLFRINILLLSLILIIFGLIIFFLILQNFYSFFNVIGFGYYFIIIILILNFIALKHLKKE